MSKHSEVDPIERLEAIRRAILGPPPASPFFRQKLYAEQALLPVTLAEHACRFIICSNCRGRGDAISECGRCLGEGRIKTYASVSTPQN